MSVAEWLEAGAILQAIFNEFLKSCTLCKTFNLTLQLICIQERKPTGSGGWTSISHVYAEPIREWVKSSFCKWVAHYGIFPLSMTFASLNNSYTAETPGLIMRKARLLVHYVQQTKHLHSWGKGSSLGWAVGRVCGLQSTPPAPHLSCSCYSLFLHPWEGGWKICHPGAPCPFPCGSALPRGSDGYGEGETRLRIQRSGGALTRKGRLCWSLD